MRVLRIVEGCCHVPSIAHLHKRRANRLCNFGSVLCWPGRKLKNGQDAATGFACASTAQHTLENSSSFSRSSSSFALACGAASIRRVLLGISRDSICNG